MHGLIVGACCEWIVKKKIIKKLLYLTISMNDMLVKIFHHHSLLLVEIWRLLHIPDINIFFLHFINWEANLSGLEGICQTKIWLILYSFIMSSAFALDPMINALNDLGFDSFVSTWWGGRFHNPNLGQVLCNDLHLFYSWHITCFYIDQGFYEIRCVSMGGVSMSLMCHKSHL